MKKLILIFLSLLLFCGPIWAEDSLNDAFDTNGGITDEQAKDAKNFVHQGKKDEAIRTTCESQGLGSCSQADVDAQGSVMKGSFGMAVENKIGMLYGLLFGASGFMSGGGPTVNVVGKDQDIKALKAGEVKNDDGKVLKKKDKAESKSDYCIYGAMGYEMISTFIQQGMQTKIESDLKNEQDTQLKALLAVKKTHEARRKTCIYQGTVYAATSACYITRAAASKGRVVMDWQYWAKMSASAGLSALYYVKANKHKKAAEKVQEVIDALPKTGECNPWTKTACFCAEPTSKTAYAETYQEVCVLNKGNPETPKMAMGCGVMAGGKMSYDKDCKCKETNSCFKSKMAPVNFKFGLGNNFMNEANKGYDFLSSGDFDSGKFDSYSLQAGVNAAKIKEKMGVAGAPNMKLTAKQQKIADEFKGILPAGVAAMAATSPFVTPPGGFGNEGIKSAMDKLPAKLKEKIADTEPLKYTGGGAGFGSNDDSDEEITFPNSGEKEAQGGTEVLTFAEKAINNADVTNSPDTPIFDIISNRYMRSGRSKLQVEEPK